VTIGFLPSLFSTQLPDPVSVLVSSSTGGFTEPAGIFPVSTVLETQWFTGMSLISSLSITLNNATGVFAAGAGLGGGFGGSAAMPGTATVGVLGGLIDLFIPLGSVGSGGSVQVAAAALHITVTGTIMLVSPARVTSTVTGSLPAFAAQTLTFVPEPGIAILLGSAFLAVATLGRRREAPKCDRHG